MYYVHMYVCMYVCMSEWKNVTMDLWMYVSIMYLWMNEWIN